MRAREVRWIALLLLVQLGACSGARPVSGIAHRSPAASDGRLEIQLTILPGVEVDRVPMRTAELRFENLTAAPLRIYLPQGEAFRANISTLIFSPRDGAPLVVPEPHPHGYVVTEVDFPLLKPGEERTYKQPFTIDPIPPGPGNRGVRLKGFAAGAQVRVRWEYENTIRRWAGGARTLDGPTKALFGGNDIPHIWLGKLTAQMTWTVPD